MNLEQKYKELQKKHQIRITSNEQPLEVDDKLNVEIPYTCGKTEKTPVLKILNFPNDYYQLLARDSIFQKTLKCYKHCTRRLKLLKLKPFKNEKDLKEIWNLEHGRNGIALITIRIL